MQKQPQIVVIDIQRDFINDMPGTHNRRLITLDKHGPDKYSVLPVRHCIKNSL